MKQHTLIGMLLYLRHNYVKLHSKIVEMLNKVILSAVMIVEILT